MAKQHHPDLLAHIIAYCDARNEAKSAFGENAIGDRSLVFQLQRGRRLWPETIDAIRRYMASGITHQQRKQERDQ